MTEPKDPRRQNPPPPSPEKEKRLAEALRANLRRRKGKADEEAER